MGCTSKPSAQSSAGKSGSSAFIKHDCMWQYADRDGQEHSIGGDGCRPLLNALMYSEAHALSAIAELAKIVASACQLGDHCVERLLVECQAVTVTIAADQLHEFAA